MYMSLYNDKKLICEVNVYADSNKGANGKDWWHIEISSYFDVKNLLDLYEEKYIGNNYFRDYMAEIQKYRFDYNEGCDVDFPKPRSYLLEDEQMTKDKEQIIDIIRQRLKHIAATYILVYKED